MRRVLWTVGMSFGGLLLGLKASRVNEVKWIFVSTIWAASIGYGFGTIFDQKKYPTKRLVIYWAATLAVVGTFLGLLIGAGMRPYASEAQETIHGVVGAAAGALLGAIIGKLQIGRLQRVR